MVSNSLKKISFRVLVLLFICAGILACTENKKQNKDHVLLLLKTLDNPFFGSIQDGFLSKIDKKTNVIVRAGNKEDDINTQKAILDSYIMDPITNKKNGRLLGLVLTPSASNDELTNYIKELNHRNIPVIIVDTRINNDALIRAGANYQSFIGSSNYEGGQLAAKTLMIKTINKTDPILLLNGVIGHESATARRKGFLDYMKSNYPNVSIIERTANWRRSEARQIVEGFIAIGKPVSGIFAANDEMALGVIEAIGNKSKKIPIIGFDAIPEALNAVKEGGLTATIAQDPFEMGSASAKAINARLNGQMVNKDQVISVKLIEK